MENKITKCVLNANQKYICTDKDTNVDEISQVNNEPTLKNVWEYPYQIGTIADKAVIEKENFLHYRNFLESVTLDQYRDMMSCHFDHLSKKHLAYFHRLQFLSSENFKRGKSGVKISHKEISKRLKINIGYSYKLIHELREEGLILSVRGGKNNISTHFINYKLLTEINNELVMNIKGISKEFEAWFAGSEMDTAPPLKDSKDSENSKINTTTTSDNISIEEHKTGSQKENSSSFFVEFLFGKGITIRKEIRQQKSTEFERIKSEFVLSNEELYNYVKSYADRANPDNLNGYLSSVLSSANIEMIIKPSIDKEKQKKEKIVKEAELETAIKEVNNVRDNVPDLFIEISKDIASDYDMDLENEFDKCRFERAIEGNTNIYMVLYKRLKNVGVTS
jgi:hypothetical protein